MEIGPKRSPKGPQEDLGPILGGLEAILGPSWGHLGGPWGHHGAILGIRGAILEILEPSWGHLGAILGPKQAGTQAEKHRKAAKRRKPHILRGFLAPPRPLPEIEPERGGPVKEGENRRGNGERAKNGGECKKNERRVNEE